MADLPKSCYAYTPSDNVSEWKLKLCGDNGELDAGIVGAAAAALGPGYRGQKVSLPSDARAAVVRKVRAAWRKLHPDMSPDEMPSGIHMTESGVDDTTATFAVRDEASALHVYQPLGFAEPPEWAPFLPVAGVYQHPIYGELDYSDANLDAFVANFKNGVYQSSIPVNAEHDLQSSGAVGWITDMRRGDDGGIDVKVEWNDRGKALIEGDRFRYVSAEVYDVWTDPVTGTEIPNVAVGMAICTNPYFKESVLRPLAASEAVITRVAAAEPPAAPRTETNATVASMAFTVKEVRMSEQDETPTATTTPPPEKAATTDEVARQLTERILAEIGTDASVSSPLIEQFVGRVSAELADRDARTKRAEEQAKTLGERYALLEAEARVKKYTDEVMGRSPENGTAYTGHIPDTVRFFCSLADKFGENSWEMQFFKQDKRAAAERDKVNAMFTNIGTGRGGTAGIPAIDQLTMLAKEEAKATGKTFAKAFSDVMEREKDLAAQYVKER